MAKVDVDISEVRKLVGLVEAHGLEELTVEEGELSITVRGRASAPAVPQKAAELAEPADEETGQERVSPTLHSPPAVELSGNIFDIVAPLVGVFYRAPTPDAPPFVDVGDEIEVGTEVGLIEAMKVYSPIPSEVAGEVVAIPAANAKLVQQGEVLVRVRISEEESQR